MERTRYLVTFYLLCYLAVTQGIELRELPEEFSNAKLPNKNQKTDRWFPYLDRIKEHPHGFSISDPESLKTEFQLYKGSSKTHIVYKNELNCLSLSECKTYPYNLTQLQISGFDPELRTIIVIDGFHRRAFDEWQTEIKDHWMKFGNFNIILVGWDGGSQASYLTATGATKVVGRQISVLLYYLAKANGYELDNDNFLGKIQLVGFSLGAQIAGAVGYDLGGKIERITGLDPAGPGFNGMTLEDRLDRSDAQLVDALHTNCGVLGVAQFFYGIMQTVGHIDLFANDGKNQPSCDYDMLGCSHKVASELYLEVLKQTLESRKYRLDADYRPDRFMANRADNYGDFRDGTSFSRFCPSILSLDNFLMNGLIKCTIPIDFTGGSEYRKELTWVHGINLDPTKTSENKYYFHTNANKPYLRDSSLMRLSAFPPQSLKDIHPMECDISITLNNNKHELAAQRLEPTNDHYEIVVPLLSLKAKAAYNIDKLNIENLTAEGVKQTINWENIVPLSLIITSQTKDLDGAKESGGWYLGKELFELMKPNKIQTAPNKSDPCNLSFRTVSIQPIKRFGRQLVAIYGQQKRCPEVVILKKDESFPSVEDPTYNEVSSRLYLNKVVIGPYV